MALTRPCGHSSPRGYGRAPAGTARGARQADADTTGYLASSPAGLRPEGRECRTRGILPSLDSLVAHLVRAGQRALARHDAITDSSPPKRVFATLEQAADFSPSCRILKATGAVCDFR